MTKIVRKTLSDRPMTAVQKRRLDKLAQQPDSEIDYSDIPELTEKFWQNAMPNPFYRPVKKQVTLRIDADILAWLRQQGQRAIRLASMLSCGTSWCKTWKQSENAHRSTFGSSSGNHQILFQLSVGHLVGGHPQLAFGKGDGEDTEGHSAARFLFGLFEAERRTQGLEAGGEIFDRLLVEICVAILGEEAAVDVPIGQPVEDGERLGLGLAGRGRPNTQNNRRHLVGRSGSQQGKPSHW